MDYAKYSYLKLTEQETLLQTKEQTTSASSSIEFTSGVLNTTITSVTDYTCGQIYLYGSTYLQCKAIFEATEKGKILLELLIDGLPVLAEERSLDVGETPVILMKSYSPATSAEVTVSLRIKIVSDSYACKLTNCVLGAWGNVFSTSNDLAVQMRALSFGDNLLVSYNQNNSIFMAQTPIAEKSFAPSDFSFVASGISHCFSTDKTGTLYFFRVDASGNLFYSKYGNLLEEIKLDTNVSVVFARKCNDSMQEDMLICYIKNGEPYYRCMTNSIIGSQTKFTLPAGKYIDIEIADAPDAEQMFVICTHSNYSNYILYSVNEGDALVFVESLKASIVSVCKKYVNVAYGKEENNLLESLKAELLVKLNKVMVNYEEFLNSKITETLKVGFKRQTSPYVIVEDPEINYELFFSQLSEYVEGSYRVTYGADCADWQPATMDVYNTGTITDTYGILNKWPFNKIKPCLVEDGKLLGYLNPNDYSQFEDGSPADITNTAYDVMVEFPKIYYKIEQDWDGVAVWNTCTKADIKIYISNKAKDGYVCYSHMRQGIEYDSIYVAAYENYSVENGILCCSGLESDRAYYHGYILNHIEELKGAQYGTFNYHVATMLQLLSLLLFKEYHGASTYGTGYICGGASYAEALNPTGINNDKGMFYGLYTPGTSNKLFGLENITGHSHLVLDGFLTTEDLHYLIYDPTNPDCRLSYGGENYKEFAPTMSSLLTSYLVRFSAGTECGFLPVCSVPVARYGQPYYNCECQIKKPSQYASNINTDLTSENGRKYMIYNYGGHWVTKIQSLFACRALYNIPDTEDFAERLICYPNSKMS